MKPQKVPPEITDAFARIERADFLPEDVKHLAAEDVALPLGYQQTGSQPHTVANMLALLDAQPGDSVLDVGSGSGWTTALLAHLVGENGRVLGVELVAELVQEGAAAVEAYSMGWAQIQQADPDILGSPEHAPFDRILVSADAEDVPEELVSQLQNPGVMVVPVRGEMLRVVKHDDDVHTSRHGPYRFVPLV